MSNDSNRGDVAVFIDFENVYVSVRDKLDANPNFEAIMDRCEDFGRVIIARAYADWYRYPRITSALYANGIEPMYVPTYYYDREQGRTGRAIKNSVDMNLCVDAMRTLYTNPNIVKFVLATGDRDFIPLVNAIRQQGKEVIVIGIGGAASAHLAQSADEFLFYESLIGKPTVVPTAAALLPDQPRAKMPEKGREYTNGDSQPAPANDDIQSAPAPEPTEEIYDMLVRAIHLARERGYVCSFGSLKLLMKELNNGEFKESRYKDGSGRPFAKFKDFVLEGERRGKVQVFTNGTVNEVFLPGEDPYKLSQFARDIEEEASAAAAEKPSEPRNETRSGATDGRRRRRRPRGGQRQAAARGPLDEQDQEQEPEATPESGVPAEVLASDFESSEQADVVFERLLERVESEDAAAEGAQFEIVEGTAPTESEQPPVAEVVAEAVEEVEAAPEATEFVVPASAPAEAETASAEPTSASAEALPALIARPFEPEEWQALREVVARFDRPVSFAQIHNVLRDARNTTQLERTNEELRSLVKQAINSGILERMGKGTRVSYRLAPPIEEATDAGDDQAAEIEQAEQPTDTPTEQEQPAEEPTAADQTTLIEQASDGQVEFATPEVPAEEPTARPKRARRANPKKAKDESVAEAAAAAVQAAPEATAVAEATEEAPAKPKQARRRKAANTPAEAEVPAKPKQARRRKAAGKPAEVEAPAEPEEA